MRILVTGASGLIGRALTARLAEQQHEVIALLHRARTLTRNDGSPIRSDLVSTVTGDVAEPGLGLEPHRAAELAASVDLVIHSAAVTGFNFDADTYTRVNVGGMRNVLGLAASDPGRRIPVLAVSTAYVCGERSGPVDEVPPDAAAPFANEYERSKAEAEGLALREIAAGHPIAIARPSIVVGAWRDGVVGEFGNIYQLVRLVAEGRIRTLPVAAEATLDLVPIDHVVDGLFDLAARMEQAVGRIFHLVSGSPIPIRLLGKVAAHFPALTPPRFVSATGFDPALLAPLERRFNLSITDLFVSYLKRDPRFTDANLRAFTGRVCPPTDEPFLHRLVDYALRAGFIVPPGTGAQRTTA